MALNSIRLRSLGMSVSPRANRARMASAGTDKIRSLIPNRKHGVPSLRTGRQGVREGRRSLTTTRHQMRETQEVSIPT